MRNASLICGIVGLALLAQHSVKAQDVDSVLTPQHRSPATIAEEIHDPQERAAFLALYRRDDPAKLLRLSREFLDRYPQSAFLAPVLEVAARSCFDLEDFPTGLTYARQSLQLLPENALLLVAVADVQARQRDNESAIVSARDALDYLERFTGPSAIDEHDWPTVKRKQQSIAWFVIGRAQTNQALGRPAPEREPLLKQAIKSLTEARTLNPEDEVIRYLLAIDLLLDQSPENAAREFAWVLQRGGELAPQAREQLTTLYKIRHDNTQGFDAYVAALKSSATKSPSPAATGTVQETKLPEYAGSAACRGCHAAIYRRWSESGMAKMLRPYEPQNVVGDFEKSNEFYAGDDIAFEHGKVKITPHTEHQLFARMIVRGGRHYFNIKQSDGSWHSYPVDYTIGSKWQQAYATTLPNGQIHVFPIQYNLLQKKWVNYWQVIDGAGSERSNPYNWEHLNINTSYQANCAVCHTSQLRNTQGGGLGEDHVVFREPGIGCEMCHGPSSAHIAAINSGEEDEKAPLDPPVEFKRISNREFVSICAQCHLQSNVHAPTSRGELNYSSVGTFFQSNASAPFGQFTRKGFYKDGRFSQTTFIVEALERSKCFRSGQASCGSCHNPHSHDEATNLTSLKFKDEPDKMCTGCHTPYADKQKASAHTHHVESSEGSRCVSCHMPKIVDGQLFRSRTHQIDDIPNAEMTIRFGRDESPNACLLCHSEKSASWVKTQLESWHKPQQMEAAR